MVELRVVINNPKTGKTYQKVLEDNPFINSKIGSKISGEQLGLTGYELEITGGSDIAGFPMRKDMNGTGRKKALLTKGPGIHLKVKGMRKRKTVVANLITEETAQINSKITKSGSKSIEDYLGIKPKEEIKT